LAVILAGLSLYYLPETRILLTLAFIASRLSPATMQRNAIAMECEEHRVAFELYFISCDVAISNWFIQERFTCSSAT
jgi:hypothetical protein